MSTQVPVLQLNSVGNLQVVKEKDTGRYTNIIEDSDDAYFIQNLSQFIPVSIRRYFVSEINDHHLNRD